MCRRAALIGVLTLMVAAAPARLSAQGVSWFGLESAVSVDAFRGGSALDRPNIIIDISAVVRLGGGWQIYVRPWFRQPRTDSWDTQIYQAALRYEHPGDISTRLDVGFVASPIGLGMIDTSPAVNPTIAPHLPYFAPMPAFDASVPRVQSIAATYPFGAVVTVAATKWDARVGLVNSAPTRIRVIGGATAPDSTPVVEAGAGITPLQGLRFGVSIAHGDYATAAEVKPPATAGRSVTIAGIEGEYAFGYTKLSGEAIFDSYETNTSAAHARSWFVQGMQTLAPRWFVAARTEGVSAPPSPAAPLNRFHYYGNEATVGFRVTPEITLRGSYYARQFYGTSTWDQEGGAQIVWAHRWW